LVETEVAKILHLQKIEDQTLDDFNDAPMITKTPLNEARNLPARVLVAETPTVPNSQFMGKQTHGPDEQLRKCKAIAHVATSSLAPTTTVNFVYSSTSKEEISKANTKLSMMYCGSGDI